MPSYKARIHVILDELCPDFVFEKMKRHLVASGLRLEFLKSVAVGSFEDILERAKLRNLAEILAHTLDQLEGFV